MLLVSRDRSRLNDVAAGTLVIEDDGLVKEQQASHDGDLRQRPAEPLGRGVAPVIVMPGAEPWMWLRRALKGAQSSQGSPWLS